MTKRIKARSDLKFVEHNLPKAVEFDYSQDITTENMRAMDKSMMHRSGLSALELHEKLNSGILVSGEEW